jgi:hypothetical protein
VNTRKEMLQSRLQQYYDCEAAILSGAQEYSIGTRRLRRADLSEIRNMIRYLERELANENTGQGRNRIVGVIPRDL